MELKDICIPVKNDLSRLEGIIAENLKSHFPFVQGVVDYVMHNGGKRLRPILTILSARLCGQKEEGAIRLGAAIEFMHTATLLHDDVIDNASLRRGRSSANGKWGNHVSVLVGDFFYCRAMDILVRHGDLKVLQVITDAITVTTEGEIFEIIKSNDAATTEADYLQIITHKTAVLIGAACRIGAILGNVSEDSEHALRKFGINLGIAFQLMDDVLDYTSLEEEFGKTNGIDLREGKLTLPLILSLRKCDDDEAQAVKNALLSDELSKEAFTRVLDIVNRRDGIRDTVSLAKSYVDKAKGALNPFKPSLEKETLLSIADYVLSRRV